MLVTEDCSFSKFCTGRWDFKICCACRAQIEYHCTYLRVITLRGFWILITCMCLWSPWCTSKDDNEVAIHSCDDNLVVYYCDCDGRQKIRKTATYTNCGPLLHNPIEGHERHSEMIKLHVCRLPFSWWKLWKAWGTQISLEKAYQGRGDGTKGVEMARLKSSHRTIRDISMGASVITTDLLRCCIHAFCAASDTNFPPAFFPISFNWSVTALSSWGL
jgi:hypothetical protein